MSNSKISAYFGQYSSLNVKFRLIRLVGVKKILVFCKELTKLIRDGKRCRLFGTISYRKKIFFGNGINVCKISYCQKIAETHPLCDSGLTATQKCSTIGTHWEKNQESSDSQTVAF